jgi:hypothetical protein
VDTDSIRASLAARKVAFRTKPDQQFDWSITEKQLSDAGYDSAELLHKAQ